MNNDKEEGRAVLATGDDFGKIKLFRYPCTQENAGFNSFGGHSDQITNVRFNSSNSHLISTGGAEKSIM